MSHFKPVIYFVSNVVPCAALCLLNGNYARLITEGWRFVLFSVFKYIVEDVGVFFATDYIYAIAVPHVDAVT